MNQHSGKILATIAFQIPVPANTNIYATPQTYIEKSACAHCWRKKKVDLQHKESFPLTYL